MINRTCQKCGRQLSRRRCVRKENILLHAGLCGGTVLEEMVPKLRNS